MKIVNVPGLNSMGKTKGCEIAGKEIIAVLSSINSNEVGKIVNQKVLDIEEINIDKGNLEIANKDIHKKALECLDGGDKAIFLGGDHNISFSIGRAFFDSCVSKGEKPCLIVFDAHADCIKPGKEPTHEEWLRAVIESGFPADSVLLVGVRNLWQEEIEFLAKNKIRRVNMNELNNNLEEVVDMIMEFASGKKLYVSLDIDVIDPAFASGTGYLEAGGLTSRQMIYILSRIARMKNLSAVDIVEVNPSRDKSGGTVRLAAKLLSELI